MAYGIQPQALGPLTNKRQSGPDGMLGVHFVVGLLAVAGVTARNWYNDKRNIFEVFRVCGIMTGAGAAGDTAVLQRVRDGTANSITDTADLSARSDTDHFTFSQVDDDYFQIAPGDTLRLATASGALCKVFVEGFWAE